MGCYIKSVAYFGAVAIMVAGCSSGRTSNSINSIEINSTQTGTGMGGGGRDPVKTNPIQTGIVQGNRQLLPNPSKDVPSDDLDKFPMVLQREGQLKQLLGMASAVEEAATNAKVEKSSITKLKDFDGKTLILNVSPLSRGKFTFKLEENGGILRESSNGEKGFGYLQEFSSYGLSLEKRFGFESVRPEVDHIRAYGILYSNLPTTGEVEYRGYAVGFDSTKNDFSKGTVNLKVNFSNKSVNGEIMVGTRKITLEKQNNNITANREGLAEYSGKASEENNSSQQGRYEGKFFGKNDKSTYPAETAGKVDFGGDGKSAVAFGGRKNKAITHKW